jgi:tRNA pseudouridine55 synthase
VVAAARRGYACDKAGHAGTLDPAASGLLLIALGDATRLLPYVPLEPKRYRFEIQFGKITDTLDSQGNVVNTGGVIPSLAALQTVVPDFRGPIEQVPPAVSALKIGGKRAYRLAREGVAVRLSPRKIRVHELNLVTYQEEVGLALFDVTCSGGTYVRALARDIAAALGTFGYALSIRRMAIGGYSVNSAVAIEALKQGNAALVSVRDALRGQMFITVDQTQITRLRNGMRIESIEGSGPGTVFAFDYRNTLVAVLKREKNGMLQPEKVFVKEETLNPESRIQKPEGV